MSLAPGTVYDQSDMTPDYEGESSGRVPMLTAGDVVSMLRRRTLLIFLLTIFFSLLAIGGFAIAWIYFPGFRSDCLIECISNIPETELSTGQDVPREEEHARFVMSQAVLPKSPTVLSETLKVSAVRETNWFKSIEANEHLLRLTEQLGAAPVRGTNFIRVSIECKDPRDPAVIVNEVVNQWLSSVKRRTAENFASKALQDAQEQQSLLDKQVESKRASLAELAARLPAGAVDNPANNIVAQNVSQYAQQVAQLGLELAQLAQYRQVYNDPTGVAVTAEDRAIVEQDPQIAELARALFLLEQQKTADLETYGPAHKVIKQIVAQITATSEKLASRRQEVLQQRRNDIREAANAAYANTQHALLLAQENVARAEAEMQDQDDLLRQYRTLEQDIEQDLLYRVQLEEFIKSRSRVVRRQAAVNVNVVQPASDPLEQNSPSIFLLPFGIFLALILPMAIAIGLELLDKSVRSPLDISRHLDVALLGVIPDTDDEEVSIERVETAVRDAPRSMVAEAFRRVRANLQFSCPVDRQRVVMVTSPLPDDGRTTVAVNLAMTIAQSGRRVLLIDANFRRPHLDKIFSKTTEEGLSNLLIGEGQLDRAISRSDVPNLDLLFAGRVPPNPAELLGNNYFHALLKEARTRYDQLIIDTPPVLLASDAAVLASAADGVILVLRAKANSRGVAKRAMGLLSDVGAHIFGAVLNAAQVTRGGYFREQLRSYYDYQVDVGSSPSELPKDV